MRFKDVTYEDLLNLKIVLDFNSDDLTSLKLYNIYRRFYTEYLIKKLRLLDYDKLVQELNIENTNYKILIWDQDGLDRYGNAATIYDRNYHGYIFIYDYAKYKSK